MLHERIHEHCIMTADELRRQVAGWHLGTHEDKTTLVVELGASVELIVCLYGEKIIGLVNQLLVISNAADRFRVAASRLVEGSSAHATFLANAEKKMKEGVGPVKQVIEAMCNDQRRITLTSGSEEGKLQIWVAPFTRGREQNPDVLGVQFIKLPADVEALVVETTFQSGRNFVHLDVSPRGIAVYGMITHGNPYKIEADLAYTSDSSAHKLEVVLDRQGMRVAFDGNAGSMPLAQVGDGRPLNPVELPQGLQSGKGPSNEQGRPKRRPGRKERRRRRDDRPDRKVNDASNPAATNAVVSESPAETEGDEGAEVIQVPEADGTQG